MQKLKVGMEVCAVHHVGYRNEYSYYFTKVVKLTAKRATLENGDVVGNEEVPKYENGKIDLRFESYGKRRFDFYRIITPEILADHEAIEEAKKIERWFNAKKFTAEGKAEIYKLFQQLNKL